MGVDPLQVEANVALKAITTKTTDCDETSNDIGTLVVTPSEPQTGAVTVVVGWAKDPVECTPPMFEGCIVARRRFSFIESTPLVVPIVIDPNCKDVPCDAFSTCSRGLCFDSKVECEGSSCTEPGEQRDGAPADPDSAVIPDAPQPPRDSGADADADGGDAPVCVNNVLRCTDGAMCAPGEVCCGIGPGASCTQPANCPTAFRLCCTAADCASSGTCSSDPSNQTPRPPAQCLPFDAGVDAGTSAFCETVTNNLFCGGQLCNGSMGLSCCMVGDKPTCMMASCAQGLPQRCCKPEDCPPVDSGLPPLCPLIPGNPRPAGSCPSL